MLLYIGKLSSLHLQTGWLQGVHLSRNLGTSRFSNPASARLQGVSPASSGSLPLQQDHKGGSAATATSRSAAICLELFLAVAR